MELESKLKFPAINCPECRKAVILLTGNTKDCSCPVCKKNYATQYGFIDLLVKAPDNVPPIDVTMEWKWLINIYESPLWRRNILLSSFMGITFKEEQRRILAALALKGDAQILDLACGPGIYSRAFAKQASSGTVVGFDLSIPMLNYAVYKARRKKLPNILFIRGNAMELPFSENSFDAANCCGALHLFPEIEKVVNAVFKILKPGGCFTGAAARYPQGNFAKNLITKSQKKTGLIYFSDERMHSLLTGCGFREVTFLHHKYFWMVFCAKK